MSARVISFAARRSRRTIAREAHATDRQLQKVTRILAILVLRETDRAGRCVVTGDDLAAVESCQGVAFDVDGGRIVVTVEDGEGGPPPSPEAPA